MRVTDIYINNYRAFYGKHHISLDKDGKNLMVYGENGSGKSSLYVALKSFMLSSVRKVDIEENVFIPKAQKNTASMYAFRHSQTAFLALFIIPFLPEPLETPKTLNLCPPI